MSFNPDSIKPAHEILFSGTNEKIIYLNLNLGSSQLLKQDLKSAWNLTYVRRLRSIIT